MSSFYAHARHKATGEICKILCADGYFGRNQYGYAYDNRVMTQDEFDNEYEEIKDEDK